jgi:hypothetical protein
MKRVFWLWFTVGLGMALILTGCAAVKMPEIPYLVCYQGQDLDGDSLMLCSPVEREFVEHNIKAPFITPR